MTALHGITVVLPPGLEVLIRSPPNLIGFSLIFASKKDFASVAKISVRSRFYCKQIIT